MGRERRGMTLIEVMLAVALSGLVLLSGRMLLSQLQHTSTVLGRTARRSDGDANATRTLYALVRRADVRPDSASRFIGDSMSARFRSLCDAPGGWLEPCGVMMFLERGTDSSALVGQLSNGERLVLTRWKGIGTLQFLDVVSGHDQWVGQWGRSITPPIAMAVVVAGDTIILPVAGR